MLSNGWFCLGRWYKISSTVWQQLGNSLMLLVCALFVCSNATITDVVWPSIISFSGSPFWYNLEVPVALNVYRPLATLVAYINKYIWRPWMTKLCASKQNGYILKGFVEYSAQSNFYEDIWLYAVNESQWCAVIALCAKHWSCLWGTRYSQQHS